MQRLLLSVAVPILLAGRIHSSDEAKFSVEEKSTLAKVFERTMKLESTGVRMYLGDSSDPIEGHGNIEIAVEDAGHIEITDEYVAMGKGRPKKLQRTFDKIEEHETQKVRVGGAENDANNDKKKQEESELEGKTVLFTSNEEANAFTASFLKKGTDEGLLEDLTEDMDLRFLLPKGKVADGESWQLDPKECASILAPGGDLKLKDKSEGKDAGSVGKEIRKHLAGKAKATWKGVREEDGKKLGVVAIDLDLTSEGDAPPQGEGTEPTHFKVELEIEGDLLWDLEAGHFRSFHAGGKVKFATATKRTIKMQDQSAELRQEVDLEGEATYAASIR